MSFTIAQLKDDLEPKLHDTSLDKLSGSFYDKAFEAARNLLRKIDPDTTMRVTPLSPALYGDVFSYVAPSDLKGKKVIALFPQTSHNQENFNQTSIGEFGRNKNIHSLVVQRNSGVKTLGVSGVGSSGISINTVSDITDNGTWAVGGQATNLAEDTFNYITGGASLRFDLSSGATTGYLENSTMDAVDLSEYDDISSLFTWVYIPSTTTLTNFILRWGSSSSDYYSATVTSVHDGTSFKTGWNLLRFDWPSSATGTPDDTAIDYLRFTVTFSGASTLTNFRLNGISAKIGSVYDLTYYSKFLFANSSGTWIEKPTTDEDTINLDVESYDCYLAELAFLCAQELQGEDSGFDIQFFAQKIKDSYREYSWDNKSQAIKSRNTYYRMPNTRR